jgi:hypothetical protein
LRTKERSQERSWKKEFFEILLEKKSKAALSSSATQGEAATDVTDQSEEAPFSAIR